LAVRSRTYRGGDRMTQHTVGAQSATLADRPPSAARASRNRVASTPHREAFRYPVGDRWESVTWAQAGERVNRIAAGLLALGVQLEDRVAVASSTRYEWVLADAGIMCAGAATTTVYPTTGAEDVQF